jgi:hypothetical protein
MAKCRLILVRPYAALLSFGDIDLSRSGGISSHRHRLSRGVGRELLVTRARYRVDSADDFVLVQDCHSSRKALRLSFAGPAQFRLRGSSRELAQPLRRLSGLANQVRRDRPQRITIQPLYSGNIYVRKYYMRAY